MIGLRYQLWLDPLFERGDVNVDCIEIVAEAFSGSTPHRLHWLRSRHRICVHCTGLSLGGPDPLDAARVSACAEIARNADALWLSHAMGFSRSGEIDLGLTVPIALTSSTLQITASRVREVMERSGRLLLIENGSSPLRIRGTVAETDFLSELCARTGCQLLIDLAALDSEAKRHALDPSRWLDAIDVSRIAQIRMTMPAASADLAQEMNVEEQFAYLPLLLRDGRSPALILALPQNGTLASFEPTWIKLQSLYGDDRRRGAL